MSYASEKECAHSNCRSTFTNDRWGAMQAHRDGWFMQKDGTAYCPRHIPKWVVSWREKRKNKN